MFNEFTGTAFILNAVYLVAAILTIRFLFWWMNRSVGVNPKEHIFDELKKGNIAVAIYFAARLIMVGMVASALLR